MAAATSHVNPRRMGNLRRNRARLQRRCDNAFPLHTRPVAGAAAVLVIVIWLPGRRHLVTRRPSPGAYEGPVLTARARSQDGQQG